MGKVPGAGVWDEADLGKCKKSLVWGIEYSARNLQYERLSTNRHKELSKDGKQKF